MKSWERALSLALALVLTVCLLPSAALQASAKLYGGAFGDLSWTYNSKTEALTISGTGPMPDCDYEWPEKYMPYHWHPWRNDSYDVRTVTVEEGITYVGNCVFAEHYWLTDVSIPSTVTEIGSWAFANCVKLSSVALPDAVQTINYEAFYNCKLLKTVSFGSGLTSIGEEAFSGCWAMKEIELPARLTDIGDSAFQNCAFLARIRIPDSVTQLGAECFADCRSLTRAEIGRNVTILPQKLFYNCAQLEEVLLPEGLSSVDSEAFSDTPALADVYYGGGAEAWTQIDGAESIDLTKVRIHCDVEQIDGHWTGNGQAPTCLEPGYVTETCACGCSRERELPALGHDIVDGVCTRCGAQGEYAWTAIPFVEGIFWRYDEQTQTLTISGTGDMDMEPYRDWDDFDRVYTPWEMESLNSRIRSVVIEEGVTSVGNFAFYQCVNLTDVSIPDTVAVIGEHAFAYCRKLPSVVIPDSVRTISRYGFYHCDSLTNVTLGDGIQKIDTAAFEYCDLKEGVILPGNLSILGYYAFSRCKNLTEIRIPDSVTKVSPYCFCYSPALKRVELGQNVPSLLEYVFCGCTSLEEVLIPEGLSTIHYYAFQNTPALRDVYYGGDEESWAQIKGANYIDLTTVRLHCGVERIDGHWIGEEYTATCTQPGFAYMNCPCGYLRDEELPARGHSMEAWTPNNDGTHYRNCAVCGQAYETGACVYEAFVTQPTAFKPGFTTYSCTACDYSYEDDYVEPLGLDFTVSFFVPAGVEQPADMISNTRTGITLPTVAAPEGCVFVGWVAEDYDYVDECPETVLTGHYTAPCDIFLNALFSRAPDTGSVYELVTEKLPEREKPGRYVITTGKTAESYMMKAAAYSYTDEPNVKTLISASGATLENGTLRDVPAENVFQISLTDTEERYYLSPVVLPDRYLSASGTAVTAVLTPSELSKWRVGYASRTGRFGFLPHTDETRCVNYSGESFVLSTIQANSGLYLWKLKTVYSTFLDPVPVDTSNPYIFSNISVGIGMVVNFTVRKSDVTNFERFWIEVVKHEPGGDRTYLYGEGQPDGALTEKASTWSVPFKEIAAKEMGVGLEARLCGEDENGQIWRSPARSASIRDYLCERLTATNNKVEQRVLAADMLNYGAAAQSYFRYDTDHLVNEGLTNKQLRKLREYETKNPRPAQKYNYNTKPVGQSNILFSAMNLGNEVTCDISVRLEQETENVQVLVKEHDTGAVVAVLDTVWQSSSFHTTFSNVGADKMRTQYDFVTLVDGVETGNIRTWSVEGFVAEVNSGSAMETKIAAANALLTYGDSAAAYLAAQ